MSQRSFVERQHPRRRLLDGEHTLKAPLTQQDQLARPVRVLDSSPQPVGQIARIVGADQCCSTVTHRLSYVGVIGGHDGTTHGQGLHQGPRETFSEAGKRQDIGGRQQVSHVVTLPEKRDHVTQAVIVDQLSKV